MARREGVVVPRDGVHRVAEADEDPARSPRTPTRCCGRGPGRGRPPTRGPAAGSSPALDREALRARPEVEDPHGTGAGRCLPARAAQRLAEAPREGAQESAGHPATIACSEIHTPRRRCNVPTVDDPLLPKLPTSAQGEAGGLVGARPLPTLRGHLDGRVHGAGDDCGAGSRTVRRGGVAPDAAGCCARRRRPLLAVRGVRRAHAAEELREHLRRGRGRVRGARCLVRGRELSGSRSSSSTAGSADCGRPGTRRWRTHRGRRSQCSPRTSKR